MRVGILTFNCAINFGAQLQAYALQDVIEKNGHECWHIAEVIEEQPKIKSLKDIIIRVVKWRKFAAYRKFQKRYLKFWPEQYTGQTLKNVNHVFDAFVSGSDQVWNGMNAVYYQEMISDERRKISYAASIGSGCIPEEYHCRIKKDLESFDYVSVREVSGRDAFHVFTDKEISVVLDPVFLPGKVFWDAMCAERIEKKPYILVYGTQMTEQLINIALELQKKTGLKICSVFPMKSAKVLDYSIGPQEFVNYVKYAEYVVTTSFHCTAFSIIYERNLIEVLHSTTGNRARDLLKEVDLLDCIYDAATDYSKKQWDYSGVKEKLEERISFSKDFLAKSLSE